MSHFKPAWLVIALVAVAAPLFADEMDAPAPEAAQIAAWIRSLDAEDYALREAAGRNLVAVGRAAIDPVAKAVLSDSPEAAWRANDVLEQIGIAGDEKTLELVSHALEQVSKSSKHSLAKSTSDVQRRWKLLRHERAVEQITKLGGQVRGGYDDGTGMFGGGGFAFGGGFIGPGAIAVDFPFPLVEIIDGGVVGPIVEIGGDLPAAKDAVPEDEKAVPKEDPPAEKPFGAVEIEAPAQPTPDGGFFSGITRALGELLPFGRPELVLPPLEVEADVVEALEGVELIAPDMIFADVGMMEFGVVGGDFAGIEGGGMHVVRLGKEWKGGALGLALLKDVMQLGVVEMHDLDVTDAHVQQITPLADLRQLSLQRCRFDREAVDKLKKHRPELAVLTFGEAVLGVSGEAQGEGFHVSFVAPNSGAQAAGIQVDDIIKSIAGEELKSFERLTHIIASRKTGDKLNVELLRQGKKQSLEVTLRAREASR